MKSLGHLNNCKARSIIVEMRNFLAILGVTVLAIATKTLADDSYMPEKPSKRNLALNAVVYPSSEVTEGSSWKAIDGNRRSCFETKYEQPSWLALDLKQNYRINTVVITSQNYPHRLDGAEVQVGKSLDGAVKCRTIRMSNNPTTKICCHGKEGRYVIITMNLRKEYLPLCEVEVYAVTANDQMDCED
ncbi:pentraxin fusion protein-like isoform X2 [Pseudophryne corroboree]|uniref:pentraxin fusion protein-like isoform X2 n=1 Tax=Pseudophryne corroboree TaxID=495146 RepID=UPI003081ED88